MKKEKEIDPKPWYIGEHILGYSEEKSKYNDSSKYWDTADKKGATIIIEKKTGKIVHKGEPTKFLWKGNDVLKKEEDERVFNETWVEIGKDEYEKPIKEFKEEVNVQIKDRKKYIYRRRQGDALLTEEEKARAFEELWVPIGEDEYEKPIGEFEEEITLRFKDGKTEMYRRRINHERRGREDFERRYSEL